MLPQVLDPPRWSPAISTAIPSSEHLLSTALAAAEAAAHVHRRWAGRLGMAAAEVKGKGDFVSQADTEAQDAALAVIRDRHPGHAVLAEEEDPSVQRDAVASAGETPLWLVDPLDGTTNFLHGHPMYAASVAVALEGRATAGAVVCSPTGERWWARRDGGAWKNGRRIHVSSQSDPLGALVATGFPFKTLDLLDGYLAQLGRVLERTGGVRRGGAASLDLCYLAEGRFDAFWEAYLNPWDFGAGIVVIEEAGGIITSLDGDPLGLTSSGVMAANSPEMLGRLGSILDGPEESADPGPASPG